MMVVLSDRSSLYLQNLFLGSPIEINFSLLAVELGVTEREVPELKNVSYRAKPGSMGIWYDPYLGYSNLILPLFPSPEMEARHKQIGDCWSRPFLPYITIAPAVSFKRRTKGWLNSISTALVDTLPTLYFDEEVSIFSPRFPLDSAFRQEYLAKGIVNNQVFLEEDKGIE